MNAIRFHVARITSTDRRSYAAIRNKNEIYWVPYHLVDGRWVSSAPWVQPIEFTSVELAELFIVARRKVMLAQFADKLAVVWAQDHQVVGTDAEVAP